MKRLSFSLLLLLGTFLGAQADVNVTNDIVGPIKLMNGVNNGPVKARSSQSRGNFQTFKDARFPFVRTHDTSFSEAYGGSHVIDITNIFPDFSKDANKPASYDFTLTDVYLKTCMDAGCEVYFRLGQKIEHLVKKYGIMPPKDFKKWAVICEHIIRHYNEGWADGHQWNIRYWEIWNEADLDITQWKTNPRTWGGDEQSFFEFYKTAALHLKKCFPNLKIGGPALAGNEGWADRFLAYMKANKVPMDFFSWHIYASDPAKFATRSQHITALLKKHGYDNIESILNEWNYIRNWNTDFLYSEEVAHREKGGAFNGAVMTTCQNEDVDILMYYDARPETCFNGLFDFLTFHPTRAYYPFYIWGKLVNDYGSQVKTTQGEKDTDLYITAAQSKEGKMGIFISRYLDNDNLTSPKNFNITVPTQYKHAVSYLTDDYYLYTEVPVQLQNSTINLTMKPNSFIFIELQ